MTTKMNVPDELYSRPNHIEQAATPKRGADYTMYRIVKMADELAAKRDGMTNDQLHELVKLCGKKHMVTVTTKAGTTFTHVQPVNNNVKPSYKGAKSRKVYPITRFTGWNGKEFGSFHVSNVKSFSVVLWHEIVKAEPVNSNNEDTEFYY